MRMLRYLRACVKISVQMRWINYKRKGVFIHDIKRIVYVNACVTGSRYNKIYYKMTFKCHACFYISGIICNIYKHGCNIRSGRRMYKKKQDNNAFTSFRNFIKACVEILFSNLYS